MAGGGGGSSGENISYEDFWEKVTSRYGDDIAEKFKAFGDDGENIIRRYGDDAVDIVRGIPDNEVKEAIELINQYGDDAVELFKQGEKAAQVRVKLESGSKTISQADRNKISSWKYTPSDELYLKYKDVYDNPMYYDQTTGEIHWPANDGFKAGSKIDKVIKKDTIFKRYGDASGEFLGNATDSFEARALAPHSENAEVYYYRLTEDYRMTTGEAAPWFGSDGGAEQFVKYKPDGSKYTIKELEDLGILEDITDLVEKGEIGID